MSHGVWGEIAPYVVIEANWLQEHIACLQGATQEAKEAIHHALEEIEKQWPKQLWPGKVCDEPCDCCSRHGTLIPLPKTFELLQLQEEQHLQQED